MADKYWYVDEAGSDTNDGLTQTTAYATANKAVASAYAWLTSNPADSSTIRLSGTLNQTVSITVSFTSTHPLTVEPHPTLSGYIDGQYTLPTGTAVDTGPDGDYVFTPLVSIKGSYVTWKVDVKQSRGRGIGIGDDPPASPNSNVTLQDLWVDGCRNGCINATNTSNLLVTGCAWSHGGNYQASDPGADSWPVCFVTKQCTDFIIEDCYGFENWGEGVTCGKGSQYGIVRNSVFRDNFSVELYASQRAKYCAIYGNLCYYTGAKNTGPAQGIAIQNEAASASFGNVEFVDVYNNIVVACSPNFVIGDGQGTGDAISDVRCAFNTFVNGVSPGALRLNAQNHVRITLYANNIYQSDGEWGSISGTFTDYICQYNCWNGSAATPPTDIDDSTDVTDFTVSDIAGDLYDGDTYPPERLTNGANYEPLAERLAPPLVDLGVPPLDAAEETDFAGDDRGAGNWQVGAINYSGSVPPSPPPAGTVAIAQNRVACNTSAGTQTIPLNGLTGTPNYHEFQVSYATADDTAADHAIWSIGAATDSSNQWAIAERVVNGRATSLSSRHTSNTACILLINTTTAATIAKASFVVSTSTGVSIHWSDPPPSGYLLTVTAYAVPNAYTTCTAFSGTKDAAVTITPGFEADTFIVHTTTRGVNEAGNAGMILSSGFGAYHNSTMTQHCYIVNHPNGTTTHASGALLMYTRIGGLVNGSGVESWGLEVAEVGATTFKIYTREGTPSPVGVLCVTALDLGGLLSAVYRPQSPSGTGDSSITTTFLPGFERRILTQATVLSTEIANSTAGAIGYSSTLPSSSYSMGMAFEYGAGTSDTQSLSDDRTINLPQHDGSTGLVATHSAFSSTAITDNYTATVSGAYQIVLAIEAPGVGITATLNNANATTLTPTVTKGPFSLAATLNNANATTLTPGVYTSVIIQATLNNAQATTLTPTVTKGPFSLAATLNNATAVTMTPTLSAIYLPGGRVLHLRPRSTTLTAPKRILMSSKREFKESPIEQGEDETIAYTVDTTNWGGTPASPACTLKILRGSVYYDVSDTNLSGDPTVAENYIVTSEVTALTRNKEYRLEILWTTPENNVEEAYVRIKARE